MAHGEYSYEPQFWKFFGALMYIAAQKGLYEEERIEKMQIRRFLLIIIECF
jgi:hypothetical protein